MYCRRSKASHGELWTLKMEVWRLKMEPWRVLLFRPLAAKSHHFSWEAGSGSDFSIIYGSWSGYSGDANLPPMVCRPSIRIKVKRRIRKVIRNPDFKEKLSFILISVATETLHGARTFCSTLHLATPSPQLSFAKKVLKSSKDRIRSNVDAGPRYAAKSVFFISKNKNLDRKNMYFTGTVPVKRIRQFFLSVKKIYTRYEKNWTATRRNLRKYLVRKFQ